MIPKGATVKIHYMLKVEGQVLDRSGAEPMSYVQGSGQLVPGLERRLEAMNAGEKKTLSLPPEEAYGPRHPDAVHKVPRNAFEGAKDLKVGSYISAQIKGHRFQAVIQEVTETEITIDLNHPLAGKTLDFDVEVVEIVGI